MSYLSEDSLVILLLCSDLALDRKNKENPKVFTTLQWQKLSEKILNSTVKRPAELLYLVEEELENILKLTSEEVKRISALLSRKVNLAIEIENLSSKGISITTRAEQNYPKRLKKVLKKKCPPVLYFAGDIRLSNINAMAVVGSRNVDKEGSEFTERLAKKCVASGMAIVSGGAKGVDTIAETSAINCSGKAISIVSDSLMKKITINTNRNAIMNGNLLMLSAVNPNASFKGFNAMVRNKYIYAMADFSTVISSDYNKGGTWSGAIENIKNKWVPILVRTEANIPLGNKELINKGALNIGEEQLDDSFDFKKWLLKIKNTPSKEIVKQLSLDSMIDKGDENRIVDLYESVKLDIIDCFVKEKSVEFVAKELNVLETQMHLWVERTVAEGLIVKIENSEKYVKVSGANEHE